MSGRVVVLNTRRAVEACTSRAVEAFLFSFGAYGSTMCLVHAPADHVNDALEDAAEWLKEAAPGMFCDDQIYEAYREALNGREPGECSDEECDAAREYAEQDCTYTESGWLPSYEWHVDTVTRRDLLALRDRDVVFVSREQVRMRAAF